jgi:hypothetical protein
MQMVRQTESLWNTVDKTDGPESSRPEFDNTKAIVGISTAGPPHLQALPYGAVIASSKTCWPLLFQLPFPLRRPPSLAASRRLPPDLPGLPTSPACFL